MCTTVREARMRLRWRVKPLMMEVTLLRISLELLMR